MVTIPAVSKWRLSRMAIGQICIAAGIVLVVLNFAGWRRVATSSPHFGQRERFDLERATHFVHDATSHSDDRRISVDENWLQWLGGKGYAPLAHVQLPSRLLAGQVANCSERSQILKALAEAAGCQCRFVGLGGHVVLEVCPNGDWLVADPSYDVVYSVGIERLQSAAGESEVRSKLSSAGHSPGVVISYLAILQSTNDNVVLPVGSPLSPRLYRAEIACAWLVWLIPAGLVYLGMRLRGASVFAGNPERENQIVFDSQVEEGRASLLA